MSNQTNTNQQETAPAGLSPEVAEALRRQKAFWHREPVERPLMSTIVDWTPTRFPNFVKRDGSLVADGGEMTPGMLDPEANIRRNRPTGPLDGDLINGWAPYEVFWVEGVMGSRVLRIGPCVWTEPFIEDWEQVDRLHWNPEQPWIDELEQVTRWVTRESKGEFPVTYPLTHGPLDMAEAAVKSEIFYTGFYQEPERMRRLLAQCEKAFVATVRRRNAAVQPWDGGYMTRVEMGLLAPGPLVWFSFDTLRNISAEIYRDFVVDMDRRICRQFPYSIVHTHSAFHRSLHVLLEEPELTAIEMTLDPIPYGPPRLEIMDTWKMLQEGGKSLFISGPMKRSELDKILETLSPVGLAIKPKILPESSSQ